MSTVPIQNPPQAADWTRIAADAQHVEDFVNGPAATLTTPGGDTRDSLAKVAQTARTNYASINLRGAWATGTAYAVRDVYTSGGLAYIVLLAHTSSSVSADLAAGKVGVYQGITAADLAQAGAAGQINSQRSGSGTAVRSQQSKNEDLRAAPDFTGADATAVLNAGITQAAAARSHLWLPSDVTVGSGYSNAIGVRLTGPGKAKQTRSAGARILQSYADWDERVIGREYLYLAHQAMANASGLIKIVLHGNSTVAGGNGESAGYKPDAILTNLALDCGARSVSVTNLGVSGTKVSDMDTSSWLSDTTVSTVVIKYGINEGATSPAGDAVEAFASAYDAKLSAIRGSRTVNTLTILLLADNSVNDSPNGRDEQWIEKTTPVLRMLARKYQCVFYDTYADFRDSENASAWMDNPYSDGRHIHPLDRMNSWIWNRVAGLLFAPLETRTNRVRVYTSENAVYATPSSLATDFPLGLSYWRARGSDGWPLDGLLEVVRHWDGMCVQRLSDYRSGGTRSYVITRTWDTQTPAWKGWSGQKTTFAGSYSNGWQDFGSGWEVGHCARSVDGIVSLGGRIKSGTTTAATVITTLPSGFRPANARSYVVANSAGVYASIEVFPDGSVKCGAAVSATWTSLDGIAFHAAL